MLEMHIVLQEVNFFVHSLFGVLLFLLLNSLIHLLGEIRLYLGQASLAEQGDSLRFLKVLLGLFGERLGLNFLSVSIK